jgi:hypothetical protein
MYKEQMIYDFVQLFNFVLLLSQSAKDLQDSQKEFIWHYRNPLLE